MKYAEVKKLYKKYAKIIIVFCALILVAVGGWFALDHYNNKLHINDSKIKSITMVHGVLDDVYELTDEEIRTVVKELNNLEYAERGDFPIYHMCLFVNMNNGKRYALKLYDDKDKESIYISSGAAKTGKYSNAKEIRGIIAKYETEYGILPDYDKIFREAASGDDDLTDSNADSSALSSAAESKKQ